MASNAWWNGYSSRKYVSKHKKNKAIQHGKERWQVENPSVTKNKRKYGKCDQYDQGHFLKQLMPLITIPNTICD